MKYPILMLGLFAFHAVNAAGQSRTDFHKAVYDLHEQQIARFAIQTKEETGKYNGEAAAGYRYRTTSFYDASTGRLLSRIQRDADLPEAIHIAEVNIYDANGVLVRDYFTSAPPWRPLHPSHAYLNLHHYNGKLHSFRQFELNGQVNYEFCEGELEGKRVRISLDWTDIKPDKTNTPAYHACFDEMGNNWEAHIVPH